MFDPNDKIIDDFVEESKEHLETIEEDILVLEEQGADLDDDLVNKVFRAAHTIKGGAGFLSLDWIKNLAHAMESILGKIRSRELVCTPEVTSVLLKGADILKQMVTDLQGGKSIDTTDILKELHQIVNSNESTVASDNTSKAISNEDKTSFLINPLKGNEQYQLSYELVADLQKKEQGGQYVYALRIPVNCDSQPGSKTVLHALTEYSQLAACGPVHFFEKTCKDLWSEDLEVVIILSTVLEPDIFSELTKVDKNQIVLITSSMIKNIEPIKPAVSIPVENDTQTRLSRKPRPAANPDISRKSPVPVHQSSTKSTTSSGGSIRVSLGQLDSMMRMAGELVLSRNALIQMVNERGIEIVVPIAQRIDAITSELQESIMATRMQSIGIVFNKFKRVVRDIAKSLDKKIDFEVEGEDVELDKTIIETISDPLTHLVRNAVDHGIESPEVRVSKGKPETGALLLKASHEAGMVIIEIKDDGAGINPEIIKQKAVEKKLITPEEAALMSKRDLVRMVFKPGFSTAKIVTDISGRGVGMDVVLSNLSKVGGIVDIESEVDKGSQIIIRLPLTLAIIPSILVSVRDERFAIPQVNLVELVRISELDVKTRIEKIGDSSVIRLRDQLVPLVRLSEILQIPRSYIDDKSGEELQERRLRIADRRSNDIEDEVNDYSGDYSGLDQRIFQDRRDTGTNNIYVVIVSVNSQRFGLIVDQLLDSEEIVVKPLGPHLKSCREYAGATILGDGGVALILDIEGLHQKANLFEIQSKIVTTEKQLRAKRKLEPDTQSYLHVRNVSHEQFVIPLGYVSRIERIRANTVTTLNNQRSIAWGDSMLALLSINDLLNVEPPDMSGDLFVIVFKAYGHYAGLLVKEVVNIETITANIDTSAYVQLGVLGALVLASEIALVLDPYGFVDKLLPDIKQLRSSEEELQTILVVEDSPFFRSQMKTFLEEEGYATLTASDGQEGIEILNANENAVDLIITDIEMPRVNGLEMTQQIRADSRFDHIPIIAVTSLSGDIAEKQGIAAGMNEYLIKLDREQITERCKAYLSSTTV